ncbi:MAG: helix-turn-helix transcriptional regulator [Myxococcales bacterium]|nr:helix-turn-helix transcriptional regulator [Myxococcales bacterium]
MNNQILRIKSERLSRGWTQTELAYFARMSSADVSRIESGRMVPYPGHAQRLARVLGLDPSELLEEVELSFSLRAGVK